MQRNGNLDEIRVITCRVKKKEQKLISTNAITRHNTTAIFRDQQSCSYHFSLYSMFVIQKSFKTIIDKVSQDNRCF